MEVDENRINTCKGMGDTPRQAYEGLFDLLLDSDCLNMVQLDNGKWVIGMQIIKSTTKEAEEWEKFTYNLYNN